MYCPSATPYTFAGIFFEIKILFVLFIILDFNGTARIQQRSTLVQAQNEEEEASLRKLILELISSVSEA